MSNKDKYSTLDKATLDTVNRAREKLMTPVLVLEIQRAYKHLGYLLTEEQRREFMAMKPEDLTAETQIILSAVTLRGQTEQAEYIRRSIAAQKPPSGPKHNQMS